MNKFFVYRANETLSARVANANPIFVKEFPASMSVEDIAAEVWEVQKDVDEKRQQERGDKSYYDAVLVIDATVLSAIGLATKNKDSEAPFEYWRQKLIRQDNIGVYDLYADEVAAAAQGASRVVLVRDCIADHNSEGFEGRYERKVYESKVRIEEVVQKWVTRLEARGVTPVVIDRILYFPHFGVKKVDPKLDHSLLRDAVIVSDHHTGFGSEDLKLFGGRELFNAYARASDFAEW